MSPRGAPALDTVFDEQRMATAARDGLQADGARTGNKVQDPGAIDAFRIGMASEC